MSHVPKVEAAATTGLGDSYNDVPKIVRKFHEQKFTNIKKELMYRRLTRSKVPGCTP